MQPSPLPRRDPSAPWTALLHPVRSAVWDSLVHHGPATSSTLAQQLAISSGLASYHLRELARHDLVQEQVGHGTRRERWWAALPATLKVDAADPDGTVDERVELSTALVMAEARHHLAYWSAAWRSTDAEDVAWRSASTSDQVVVTLSLEQLRELDEEIAQLVERWRRAPTQESSGSRRVRLTVRTYPLTGGEGTP